jgi:hypothetical protein
MKALVSIVVSTLAVARFPRKWRAVAFVSPARCVAPRAHNLRGRR